MVGKKWAAGGLMRNLLKGVINPDVASGNLPSKNLHCIAKVGNWMFMHGGLMLDTIMEFMEKEKEINGNEFISKVDKLFQNSLLRLLFGRRFFTTT